MKERYEAYLERLSRAARQINVDHVEALAQAMRAAWRDGGRVFLCGNGGSAANANHLANDFTCGIEPSKSAGIRAISLSANVGVMTALANDISYDHIYASQLRLQAQAGDVLVALSGSGNSPNVVMALEAGRELGLRTFALLGYSGGKCKTLADKAIHLPLDDMQIAEDMQLIIGHMVMQYLRDVGK